MAVKKTKKEQRGAKKKAETIEKRQKKQQEQLLAFLEELPNIGAALSRVGINRSTYSRWRTNDATFAKNADDAIERGIEQTADIVEISLLNKARDGDVQAQKYYLTNNHKRYRMDKTNEAEKKTVLTEEMKKRIAETVFAWSLRDTGDERDADYELIRGENDELLNGRL